MGGAHILFAIRSCLWLFRKAPNLPPRFPRRYLQMNRINGHVVIQKRASVESPTHRHASPSPCQQRRTCHPQERHTRNGAGLQLLALLMGESRSLSDLHIRMNCDTPGCPLSRFYCVLGALPWAETGYFGQKWSKPDRLLAI